MKWHKVEAGHYASDDGRYVVKSDGYERGDHIGAEGNWKTGSGYEGFIGGEWAAVLVEGDENLDWFPTKREAVAFCEQHGGN